MSGYKFHSDEDNTVSISNRLACIEHELEERNKIERAKLAEMRASRLMQALTFQFEYDYKPVHISTTFDGAQKTANKLTAEVLEKNNEK